MSKTQERVIRLISQPQALRGNQEIKFVLPWLKKKSEILMKIADSILKEIVRNCEFLKTDQDEVIIRQGDQGDCLYILLKGTVSVYINDKLDLDDDVDMDNTQQQQQPQETRRSAKNWLIVASELVEDFTGKNSRTNKKVDRKQMGKKIVSFGSGKVFGEIALLEHCVRTASVLSDEECHLLVIRKHLYNSTLKAYHEKDFKEKREFINHNPLFMNWSRQHKRQLERGLIKESYSPDMAVIKQGDDIKGLVFVREGVAKVLVEPEKHVTQYPHLSLFTTENDVLQLEHIKPSKGSAISQSSGKSSQCSSPVPKNRVSFENIHVRRKQGYAAAEKRLNNRSVILCTVRNGAMFGDIEMMQNLKTYCQSVTTLTYTEVYCVSQRNVERLIYKKHPGTVKTLRDIVVWKMCNRATSIQGSIIPFVKHLVFKMTEERKPEPRVFPTIHSSATRLPDREGMFQNIIQEYLMNRAQLLEPVIPGGVYYKTVMRKKAKQRETERRRTDGIKRQQLEKDMRTRLAAYTSQIQTNIDIALSSHSDTDTDDDEEVDLTKQIPAVLTPKHLSQSDPVLSRPSSSRSRENQAFMTEVENISQTVDNHQINWNDNLKWNKNSKENLINQQEYDTIYQKNHTLCFVYDESVGKSMLVHSGPSEIKINDKLSQSQILLDDEIIEEDEYDELSLAPSDGRLVGAPSHMISKRNIPDISPLDDTNGNVLSLPAIKPRQSRNSLPHISVAAKPPNMLLSVHSELPTADDPVGLFNNSYKQRARTATESRTQEEVITLPKVFSAGKPHTRTLLETT